jgi:hypothetical protein
VSSAVEMRKNMGLSSECKIDVLIGAKGKLEDLTLDVDEALTLNELVSGLIFELVKRLDALSSELFKMVSRI